MEVLIDDKGSMLSFNWPGNPGVKDRTVAIGISMPGKGSAVFRLDMHACDQMRQELQRVMETPNRGKTFEG